MTRKRILAILLVLVSSMSCERNVRLTPHIGHFDTKKHLKTFDGSEGLNNKITLYAMERQKSSRAIASDEKWHQFSPHLHPKFPLPYFLVPEELCQFLDTRTTDDRVLEGMFLKISGKRYCKFLVHPVTEHEFEFLKSAYIFIDVNQTEFYATPIETVGQLLVWNRNNTDRKAFKATLEVSQDQKNLNRQIIEDLPIKSLDENH